MSAIDRAHGSSKFYKADPLSKGEALSQPGAAQMVAPDDIQTADCSGTSDGSVPVQGEVKVEENLDPLRVRIARPTVRRGIWRILARLTAKHELTAEERAAIEDQQHRKMLEALLRKESVEFRLRIVNCLNRMEKCYRYPKSKSDFLTKGVQEVRFEQIRMQPDAIYFKIHIPSLPRGVDVCGLMDQAVVTELSMACGHRVSSFYEELKGAWYIVERASGAMGIPNHVMWSTMMDLFPESADGLSLPLGVTTNGRRVYKSLSQMFSLLVGGTIGSGKSNCLNSFICALIKRNPPERLRLLMVDLKGGLEFGMYEGIPHLMEIKYKVKKKGEEEGEEITLPGIAYDRDQVPYVLAWLFQEGERRIKLLKAAGVKDIARYNQHHRSHILPQIVFIVDELADLKINKDLWDQATTILTNVAQRFRAVGIHLILCTQMPKSEILPTPIKAVLPAKIAFSCPTIQGSMAILDNGNAKGLFPQGRCILQWQDEQQIQVPLMTDEMVKETVDGAKAGKFEKVIRSHDVTPLEIQNWALDNDNGYLSYRKIYTHFKSRNIAQAELESWFKEWEGQEIVVGSSLYIVKKAEGNKARRLVAVDNQPKEPTSEAGS